MKNTNHLPIYGIGPLYVGVIILLTVVGVAVSCMGWINAGKIAFLRIPMAILGTIAIMVGVIIWCAAVIGAKIDTEIMENHLVTTGVYAWVRNPIYSAFAIVCAGVCLWTGNLWLLILPVIFWLLLTWMIRPTEEKWLHELYGKEYEKYCQNVNRCIPWFPKKKR